MCGEAFSTRAYLAVHKAIKHGNEKIPCPTCGKTFGHKKYLRLHIQRVHDKPACRTCMLCRRTFMYKHQLKTHVCTHPEATPNAHSKSCPTCGKSFADNYQLNQHLQTHDPNRPRDFACLFCDKRFFTGSSMRQHVTRVHKQKKPRQASRVKKQVVDSKADDTNKDVYSNGFNALQFASLMSWQN